MDYLEFYGLSEEPFGPALSERFYFESPQHEQAMLRLSHAVHTMKGLAVLVGALGTGKSLLARRLLAELPEHAYLAALLVFVHHRLPPERFLGRLAAALGVEAGDDDPLDALVERLRAQRAAGRRAVVLLDEAGILAEESIRRELRGLLALEWEGERLLTFVVVGAPELDALLAGDSALQQRVASRSLLRGLDPEGTRHYMEHRLRVAGCAQSPFAEEIYPRVHAAARGIPRLINTLGDNLLLEGWLARQREIPAGMVESVAANLGFPLPD